MIASKRIKKIISVGLALAVVLELAPWPGAMLSKAAAATQQDILDPAFIASHGGNSVTVQADANRSPYDVFGEAFGTDNPVEGATKTARAIMGEEAARHVANYYDPVLGKDVFKVEVNGSDCLSCYLHNATYNSATGTWTGGNDDRQRIEIRPPEESRDRIGLENDITAYHWNLKIDKDIPKPDGFFHIFQYKAYNSLGTGVQDLPLHDKVNFPNFSSSEDGNPILTFTISSSAKQNLEFRYADIGTDAGQETLASIPLDNIKDRWLDITVKILNSEYGWVTMQMKDALTGEVLMAYDDPDRVLDVWRRPEIKYNGNTFEGPYPAIPNMINRPKWGIYRKADKSNPNVKDAKIYLSDITLYKAAAGVSPVNLAYGKKAYNFGATSGNAMQLANAHAERLVDGVQIDPVVYSNLTAVPQDNNSALGDLSWIGTESSKKGSVVVDLGKKMTFSQLKLFMKTARLKTMNMWISDDEADHTESTLNSIPFSASPDYTYSGPNSGGEDTANKTYTIDLGTTYTSRYIRLYFENGSGSNSAGTTNGIPTFTMTGPPRITELEIYNAPQKAKNVQVAYTTGSQATISWDDVPSDHFVIYDNGKVLVDNVEGNSYTFTNLDPGAVYNLSVRNVYNDPYSFKPLMSAESEVHTLQTDGSPIIPNPPASASVTASTDKTISVAWEPVADAQSYRVSLVTDAVERIVADEYAGTSYQLKDLSPGTSYQVKIYAIRRGALSAQAAQASVVTAGIQHGSDNLLYNKEVQYPRVWNDDTSSYSASKALDNNDGSRWVALKGSTTAWMMVDIGAVTPVNTLEYYSYQNKLKKVSFYYATDGDAFKDPNSAKWTKIMTDDRVAQGKYGNPAISQIAESLTLPAPIHARYIKFTVDEVDGDINVNEVKAYGPIAFTGNSALSASNTTGTGTLLNWMGATTTIPAESYHVYQDDEKVATVSSNVYQFQVTGLLPATTYNFRVRAVNESVYGAVYETLGGLPLQVTTLGVPAEPGTGSDSDPDSDPGSGTYPGSDKDPAPDKGAESGQNIIEATLVPGEQAYLATISPASISSGKADSTTEIRSELGIVTLPGNMFASSELSAANEVKLKVAAADRTLLSPAVRQQIGERPVIDVTLFVDGKQKGFNDPAAQVQIAIPYKPTAEELSNPEHIMVWYVDDTGKAIPVPSGKYDVSSGRVTFTTTHFSKYAVGYVVRDFGDLQGYDWATHEIEVLAAKGIIQGKSDQSFDPGTAVTRGEFIALLMRTLSLSAKTSASFADVQVSDFFYKEVLIAKALGIVNGKEENRFAPNERITRQDMMTMVARALKQAGTLTDTAVSSGLSVFTDHQEIAAYAEESIAQLLNHKLIQGSGSQLEPLESATRAEVAVLLYRIYNQ
ncbi:S-layer homology domain-containing protein [Paenibacillus ferrarius]|uniref:S-layer homology domain-containing protein n=1 Tax=Paenibacillus ferrarius TaxID=1469647 RepID=UPI003D2788C5